MGYADDVLLSENRTMTGGGQHLLIECPRCGEQDQRSVGTNTCGLCECEFFVACNGSAYAPRKRRRSDGECGKSDGTV